jgi:NTE family protein
MTARQLSDIGIVLSGGGTRGIAHIGVLRALGERGIFPDCIAGASAGAIVGALYAAGYAPPEMLEFFIKKNPFRLSKVAFSKPGIIDTAKVVSDFEEYFPENSFEALGRELRIVATDLTRGEPVEFDSGALIPAVLASSSVPLLFTPLEIGDQVFADGGIVSNFPAELLEGRCRALLGVHASPIRELARSDLNSSLTVLKRARGHPSGGFGALRRLRYETTRRHRSRRLRSRARAYARHPGRREPGPALGLSGGRSFRVAALG